MQFLNLYRQSLIYITIIRGDLFKLQVIAKDCMSNFRIADDPGVIVLRPESQAWWQSLFTCSWRHLVIERTGRKADEELPGVRSARGLKRGESLSKSHEGKLNGHLRDTKTGLGRRNILGAIAAK